MNSLVAHIMDAGNVNGKMLNGELTYADDAVELPVYGTEDSAIEDVIMSPAVENGDDRTFNILGVEVKNPTAPGVYIRGGKKFIVR